MESPTYFNIPEFAACILPNSLFPAEFRKMQAANAGTSKQVHMRIPEKLFIVTLMISMLKSELRLEFRNS